MTEGDVPHSRKASMSLQVFKGDVDANNKKSSQKMSIVGSDSDILSPKLGFDSIEEESDVFVPNDVATNAPSSRQDSINKSPAHLTNSEKAPKDDTLGGTQGRSGRCRALTEAVSEATYVPHQALEIGELESEPKSDISRQEDESAVESSCSDSESDGTDYEKDAKYPLSVELKPFRNKAGGHTAIFQFSHRAVCKTLQNRENMFYETVEKYHKELLNYMPKYIGVLNVRHTTLDQLVEGEKGDGKLNNTDAEHENENGNENENENGRKTQKPLSRVKSTSSVSGYSEVLLDDNMHILPNSMRSLCREPPKKYKIGVSGSFNLNDQRPSMVTWSAVDEESMRGATTVNRDLRDLVLKEAFGPERAEKSGDKSPGKAFQQIHQPSTAHRDHINSCLESLRVHHGGPCPTSESNGAHLDTKTERFILLEDLTHSRKKPCVLDLKMGTRQYGVDAPLRKQQSQIAKCKATTSRRLGVRICGMQVRSSESNEVFFRDKYFGREVRGSEQVQCCLMRFLYDGTKWSIIKHIPKLIKRLGQLESIILNLKDYRLYGASLLMVYDQIESKKTDISIRLIDFAQCVTAEHFPEYAAAPPAHRGKPDIGFMLGLRTLEVCFLKIYSELTNSEFTNDNFSALDEADFKTPIDKMVNFDSEMSSGNADFDRNDDYNDNDYEDSTEFST